MQAFHVLYLINYICWVKTEYVCCEDTGLGDPPIKGQFEFSIGHGCLGLESFRDYSLLRNSDI
jgi:hypothetical protein